MTEIFKIPVRYRKRWTRLRSQDGQFQKCDPDGGVVICTKKFEYKRHIFKPLGFYIFLDFKDASKTGPLKRFYVYKEMNPAKSINYDKNYDIGDGRIREFEGAWLHEEEFNRHFRAV
jgi:hypothetical protein